MAITRSQFVDRVRFYMDAEGSARWDEDTILEVGGMVFENEWSGILNQNKNYRMNTASVTTDSEGRIAIADLTTGTGDTAKHFFRVLSGPTDGQVLYRETDYQNVPLGIFQNYQYPWAYLYYLAGDYWQLLPIQNGLALSVVVNWTPTRINDLAGDGSTIDFPAGFDYIPIWQTAGTLLLKGGAEAEGANAMFALADDARTKMYGQIGRLTTKPSSLQFPDTASSWGGG